MTPRSTRHCWEQVASLVVSFLVWTVVTTTPVKNCVQHVDVNGAIVHNCSRTEMSLLSGKLSDKAESLDFSWNKFTEIPNLTESAECSSKCPMNDATSHCRQVVSLSRNHISKLNIDNIGTLKCLRILDFSFNGITAENLNMTTFSTGFFHLQRLLLNNNPLGSLPSSSITQPYLPDLHELDLSHCDLDSIHPNSVDDFGELRILNLSFNKLKTIHADTFKGLNKLEHLDLTENQLTFFPEHIFGDLIGLKVLLLSDNKIKAFHENAFYRDSSLQGLYLRNNRLTSVPYIALDKVTMLQTLDLSQNPIKKVDRSSIQSSVHILVLDNMPDLTELGPYALASFPNLVSISIRGNQALETIDRKFLGDNLSLLKHVSLENNKLYTLDYDALPWKQLEGLKLSGNPWMCDESLEWMIETSSIREGVTCASPLMLKGHNIKTLKREDLMRDYSLQSTTAIILLFLCLPVFGAGVVFIWRRRRFCPCNTTSIKSQYVTLFSRDLDDDAAMTIELKSNEGKMNSVSNNRASDSIPFFSIQDRSIKEELEAEDV